MFFDKIMLPIFLTSITKIKKKTKNISTYTIGVKLHFPLMLEHVHVL